jgi:hypothetical protein
MTWLEQQGFRIRNYAVFGCGPANHALITDWRMLGILSIPVEEMVATCGLESLTSTVSPYHPHRKESNLERIEHPLYNCFTRNAAKNHR